MPKLLRPSEVARQFSVDRRTVARWCLEGRLPAMRVGGVWRIHPDDLARFVQPNAPLGVQDSQQELNTDVEAFAEKVWTARQALLDRRQHPEAYPRLEPEGEETLTMAIHSSDYLLDYLERWRVAVSSWLARHDDGKSGKAST